jgi:hypothetical protein
MLGYLLAFVTDILTTCEREGYTIEERKALHRAWWITKYGAVSMSQEFWQETAFVAAEIFQDKGKEDAVVYMMLRIDEAIARKDQIALHINRSLN